MEEEEVVDVEFGFTFVTWPSTPSQEPRPCSQQAVALEEPPEQHQDWSGHWWTWWSEPGRRG